MNRTCSSLHGKPFNITYSVLLSISCHKVFSSQVEGTDVENLSEPPLQEGDEFVADVEDAVVFSSVKSV